MRQRQHFFRNSQCLAGVFLRGNSADQDILVSQPGFLQLAVGFPDRRRRRVIFQLDQLPVKHGHRAVEQLLAAVNLDLLANLKISFGHALRQHALPPGFIDRRVQITDLRQRDITSQQEETAE